MPDKDCKYCGGTGQVRPDSSATPEDRAAGYMPCEDCEGEDAN